MVRVALLIGVSNYATEGFTTLPSSYRDINGLKQILESDLCEFDDVQTLPSPSSQEMQEAIESVFCDRKRDDLILLYFSGHGIKDERGKLYLTATNTRKGTQGVIRSTAVPASFVHEIMEDCRSKYQIILLDCCFSGAFAQGMSVKDDSSVDIKNQLGGEGKVVLASSTSTQYSFTQKESEFSLYTCYLIEGIKTGLADQDKDGVISLDELHRYAKAKVQGIQPTMKPEIYAAREGHRIVLSKVNTTDPVLEYRRKVQNWIKNGEIPLENRKKLDDVRFRLQISSEQADALEEEELRPHVRYHQGLQQYRERCVVLSVQKYPLSNEMQTELRGLRERLGLQVRDAETINKDVFAEAESVLKDNRSRYEANFLEAVQKEFPLGDQTRNMMKSLQQNLKLTNEDIRIIEKLILGKKEDEEINKHIAYKNSLDNYRNGFANFILLGMPAHKAHQLLRQVIDKSGLSAEDVSQVEKEVYANLPSLKKKKTQEEKERQAKRQSEQEQREAREKQAAREKSEQERIEDRKKQERESNKLNQLTYEQLECYQLGMRRAELERQREELERQREERLRKFVSEALDKRDSTGGA
jgi:hypothetical protein